MMRETEIDGAGGAVAEGEGLSDGDPSIKSFIGG